MGALIGLSLVALLLDLPPCLWALQQGVTSFFCLTFWLVLLNVNLAVDSIAWADSVKDSRGWCVISSRIKLAGLLAIPTAVLCMARLMARTFSRDLASQLRPADKKGDVLNYLVCFVAPLVAIGTHFLFSPVLYAISKGSGCEPAFFLCASRLISVNAS
jgi:pheromone a factor receptor